MCSAAKLSFQLERAIYLSASPSTGLHYRYGNTRRLIQNCSARWGVSRDFTHWCCSLLRLLHLLLLGAFVELLKATINFVMSVCLSICLSVSLSACLSICLSVCLSACLSLRQTA